MPEKLMLETQIYSSIEHIERVAWNACFPDTLENYDYLRAVEASGLKGFEWRYVTVLQAGEVIAAASGFMTEYKLDTTLIGASKILARRVQSTFPRALAMRLG